MTPFPVVLAGLAFLGDVSCPFRTGMHAVNLDTLPRMVEYRCPDVLTTRICELDSIHPGVRRGLVSIDQRDGPGHAGDWMYRGSRNGWHRVEIPPSGSACCLCVRPHALRSAGAELRMHDGEAVLISPGRLGRRNRGGETTWVASPSDSLAPAQVGNRSKRAP